MVSLIGPTQLPVYRGGEVEKKVVNASVATWVNRRHGSDNDRLYIQQIDVDQEVWSRFVGRSKKKPAAFGMDTHEQAKDIEEKDQGEKEEKGKIYIQEDESTSKRKVAKGSVTSEHTNISSHGSLADYSALSSTPSLKNDNASGPVIDERIKNVSGIRNTRSQFPFEPDQQL